MAVLKEHIRIQVVCADLAVERQNVLKEQISDQLTRLNNEDPSKEREMVFISNQDNRPLHAVLTANPKADVVLTGFNATRKVEGFDSAKDDAMVDETNSKGLVIDPTLRLGAYIELNKMINRGSFKMRRMIFVGDLNQRIRDFIKLGFEVQALLFADAERESAFEPVQIKSSAQLPKIGGFPEKGQIDISNISQLTIGDITFDGVVNMEEEAGHFYIKDFTVDDSVKKMLALDSEKGDLIKEAVKEEKMAFVRTKRMVLVMEKALAKVVHQRLKFDQMEQVFEWETPEQALKAIEETKSTGVADYLETAGYDAVNKVLDATERELMLVSALGRQLLPEYLENEMKASGEHLKHLKDEEITELIESMEPKVLERLTAKLAAESQASFLARIPPDIREPLIVEFLRDKTMAVEAWRVIGPKGQKEVLNAQSVEVMASIMLTNTKLFKAKFQDVNFNQDAAYDSAKQFGKLDEAGIKLRMEIFSEGLKDKLLSYAEWATVFTDEERDLVLTSFISLFPESFFNQLDPAFRKIIWNQVGKKGEAQINAKLKPEHKRAILKGAKAELFQMIKLDLTHLLGLVKSGDGLAFGQTLFLHLKQFNKVESKTGLFKKITGNPKLKAHRVQGISELLSSERGAPIFAKLTAQIDALNVGYDALICRRDFVEQLTANDALKDATLTIVEDIVDTSLLEMFSAGKVNLKDYASHYKQVEKKLEELKKKLREQGADDPVGGYLLETMMIMMNMASAALKGQLDSKMLEQLDERGKVKEEVMKNVENRVVELDQRVEQLKAKLPQMEAKLAADNNNLELFGDQINEKLKGLQTNMAKFQDAQTKLNTYNQLKLKVARTQQQLSQRFFEIIRPLMLSKLHTLPAPLARVVDTVKQTFLAEQAPKHRLIFKFTDDELKRIAKRKVVFATEDAMLRRFIVTCMQIDKLDNTLFQITNLDDLPDDPDLLFIGNDLEEYDFSTVIKPQYTVAFADDDFYNSLLQNESQKAKIRTNLIRYTEYKEKLKRFLETEGTKLKLMATSLKKKKEALQRTVSDRKKFQKTLTEDQQKLAFLKTEKETLDEKFALVDGKFKSAKSAITEAISAGKSTTETITAQAKEMAAGLSNTLDEINKELAQLMVVKNVKDSVEVISTTAQNQIIAELDKLARVKGGKKAIKHIVVSGDGMLDTMELQKAFEPAIKSYFGTTVKYEELGMGRMEAEIAEQGKRPHLLMILGDDTKSNLSSFKELAKRLRGLSPESCILFFIPYPSPAETTPELIENLNTLRKYAAPINSNLEDYSLPSKLVNLLGQVAPENPAAESSATSGAA
ncbi:MAG: hypothetical protein RRB13_11150 [bacterium]|nr:hypothetical protein [bacterium]